MNAQVYYEMAFGDHPWQKEPPYTQCWTLWRVTRGRIGLDKRMEAVAIFNLDAEARMFMDFIIDAGLEDKLVRPPWQYTQDIKRLAEQERNRR